MKISYVYGALNEFDPPGKQIIANICNEVGIWSNENLKMVSSVWPQSRICYLRWYRRRLQNDFAAGAVQFVKASDSIRNRSVRVANMVAQSAVARPIRYRPFERCLLKIGGQARRWGAVVRIPKPTLDQIDSWPDLEERIQRFLCHAGVTVVIYDPVPATHRNHPRPIRL